MKENIENTKVLVAGFQIVWVTDHCINKDTQSILDSLTSLLLVKTYYSFFQPEHFGRWCYYCHLKHMILRTILDRGDNSKYLNGELKFDESEEKGFPYPFYEEWLKKAQPVIKNFVLKKLYIINIVCSNKFITSFLIY